MTSSAYLECGHCGEPAIYGDSRGLFTDGGGERCITCGMPGQVFVDASVGDDEHDNTARWDDENAAGVYCRRPGCEDCAEMRVEDGMVTLSPGEEKKGTSEE